MTEFYNRFIFYNFLSFFLSFFVSSEGAALERLFAFFPKP